MLKNYFEKNKKTIILCFILVALFGIISHGYMFSNGFLSHDYLNEVFSNSDHKTELGRILYSVYKIIFRGSVSSPWIVGFFGLLWLSITLYVLVKTFDKQSNLAFVIIVGGILTTNITVISTIATYTHDFDANMFALMMATLSFSFWKKDNVKSYLLFILCLVISLGIYQSYIQVTITLIIFDSILSLLNKNEVKEVFIHGVKTIGFIVFAICAYALLVKVATVLTGVALQDGGYNSVLAFTELNINSIGTLLYECYYYYIYYGFFIPWLDSTTLALVINGLLSVIVGISFICLLIQRKLKIKELLLLVLLIVIIPLGSNGIYLVSNGAKHQVMAYACCLYYLLYILIIQEANTNKIMKHIACILFVVVLSENIRTANATYYKKGLEYNATISYMTNVTYDMNKTEGYEPGKTKVMFIGYPDFSYRIDDLIYTYRIGGSYYSCAIQKYKNYESFYKYVLQQPINLVSEDKEYRLAIENKQEVKQMGYYPSSDSIKIVDDILIVKFADSGY